MARTNFIVLYDGVERLLFSLRTTPSGVIFVSKPELSNFGSGDFLEVKDMHLTAHFRRHFREEGIFGHKIKTTMLTRTGQLFEKSVIVKVGGRSKLVWPINTAIIGNMDSSQYNLRKNSSGKSVNLIGTVGYTQSIVYTLFVHDSAVSMPRIQGFSVHTELFDEIGLTLYLGFVKFPNFPMSVTTFNIKGAIVENGTIIGEQSPIMQPMHTKNLENYVQAISLIVSRRAASEANAIITKELEEGAALDCTVDRVWKELREVMPSHFTRWPPQGDQRHYEYGSMARSKNEIYISPVTTDGIIKPHGFDRLPPMHVYKD